MVYISQFAKVEVTLPYKAQLVTIFKACSHSSIQTRDGFNPSYFIPLTKQKIRMNLFLLPNKNWVHPIPRIWNGANPFHSIPKPNTRYKNIIMAQTCSIFVISVPKLTNHAFRSLNLFCISVSKFAKRAFRSLNLFCCVIPVSKPTNNLFLFSNLFDYVISVPKLANRLFRSIIFVRSQSKQVYTCASILRWYANI
jgi:hypothetical protein